MDEHKLILRALDVLDAICGSVEKSRKINEDDVGKILDFLRWFADAHHQAKEETILFPALKRTAAAQERPVVHMMFEHSQERSLVEAMEKDLRLAQVSEFVSAANHLSSTLRNHIYKEDRLLFEAADAVLTPTEDEAVFEQLTRFDTPIDKELLAEKLKELRSLEWQYLRK
jgi:hemerythrin-like domain-containing protein